MARLWQRTGLRALIAVLVMSTVTISDHSADHTGHASDATSLKEEQNPSTQTRISSAGFPVAVSTFIAPSSVPLVVSSTSKPAPNTRVTVGTQIKPSPVVQVSVDTSSQRFSASEYLAVVNTGLDYDLTDIFGENAAFDLPFGSASSTHLASSPVMSKKTKGNNDHRSTDHSITLPGSAPLTEFEKISQNSLSIDDEVETHYIVHHLPNGEPFHTPPPLTDDSLSETHSEGQFAVIGSPYQSYSPYFLPGRSIPKVVNKPGSPDMSNTHSRPPVDLTPVNQGPLNFPRNVQTDQISVPILNTTNGSPQVGAAQKLYYGAPPQVAAPPRPYYGALPQVAAPPILYYGAPPQIAAPQASALSNSVGVAPQAGAPLISTNGAPPEAVALSSTNAAPPQASAPLSSTFVAPPRASGSLSQAYDASPENHLGSIPSNNGFAADTYTYEMPSEEVREEETYSGFLSTLWRTGSPREAAAGYASDLWNRFTKGVETEAAKKSKIILSKAAPFVKKVVGAKVVESFLQGDGAIAPKINGVSAPVVSVAGESKVPVVGYGAPPTKLDNVLPEAHLPSYMAIHPEPQAPYGAPPVFPAVSAPSWPVVANKPEDAVQPLPPASGQTAKYFVEEAAKHVVPSPPTKYYFSEPVEYNIQTSKQPGVILQGPSISVGETGPSEQGHQHPYPAAPLPEYNPSLQYGPPFMQPKAAAPQPPVFLQIPEAHDQNYPYLPPQASHLIRNQGDEQQEKESIPTRPRQGIFAIVDKAREGYNTVYNTIEYGRNLTHQATAALGGFWPGNWFRSTNAVSPLGESPAAPAAVSIVSSYAPPVVIPISNSDTPPYYPINYQYPVKYDGGQYPGYVVRSGLDDPQGPVAHSYIAALSGPVVQGEVQEPNRF